jgi:formate hydrogenlyase subunit 3/multisubunit Na+/H+ antiporter MnhD subunit
VAGDAYTFLLSWEFMSIASWALVMAHHRGGGNARAGYVYLVMASFGTFMLLLSFALLASPPGGYAFDAMRAAPPVPAVAGLAFILALIGAGSKAGIVPLHVWLPLAHPAAPSHVSALMSGVMTKVAVYGFVRIVFDLAGPQGWWWSVPVLMVGAGTALLGVLYALMHAPLIAPKAHERRFARSQQLARRVPQRHAHNTTSSACWLTIRSRTSASSSLDLGSRSPSSGSGCLRLQRWP